MKDKGNIVPYRCYGRVIASGFGKIQCVLPFGAVGDICKIQTPSGPTVYAEIKSYSESNFELTSYSSQSYVYANARVENVGPDLVIDVPTLTTGTVLDSAGNIIEVFCNGRTLTTSLCVNTQPPAALERQAIRKRFLTGVSAIDLCLPVGFGQRMGIFAPAGVGKSSLLGMIAAGADVDLVVVALIGERGREVREFIRDTISDEVRRKSVFVVATSDESAERKVLAAKIALSLCENARREGKEVLLLMDSLTRVGRALRDIGLSSGELPAQKGYPASVFRQIAHLVERAGSSRSGSVTAFFTVLEHGSEFESDTFGDEIRSLIDGHITLCSEKALRGQYPAIRFSESLSRLAVSICSDEQDEVRQVLSYILSLLEREKELALLSEKVGPALQSALELEAELQELVSQRNSKVYESKNKFTAAKEIIGRWREQQISFRE